jgi:hypothetical protein
MAAFRPPPERHWRSYGTDPLPTAAEALDEPLRAFPSWFLKVTCRTCGKDRMLNENHATDRQRETPIRVLLARARHDGCGGRAGRVELLTGIDGVSRPAGPAHRAAGVTRLGTVILILTVALWAYLMLRPG